MFDLLIELEDITNKLDQIVSLFNCMTERYFHNREPIVYELEMYYNDYVNIMTVIKSLTEEQRKKLDETTEQLYKKAGDLI